MVTYESRSLTAGRGEAGSHSPIWSWQIPDFVIRPLLRIHGFCIYGFSYSLKFIHHHTVSTLGAFVVNCRCVQSGGKL